MSSCIKKTGRQDDTKITFNDIILNVNYHKLSINYK